MNVTELARILKVHPQELREVLPQIGFDIGQRAIKIDNRTAQRIIREWHMLYRNYKKAKEDEALKNRLPKDSFGMEIKKVVVIPQLISVRDFSALSMIPVNKILTELMKNGVFTSMNERIDFDTASIIADNLGIEVKLDEKKEEESSQQENSKLFDIIEKEDKKDLQSRPPVVVVMGHVDHGKTKLLDAIRRTNVMSGEAGGITQHIGAYQVERRNRLITFIDTPGHEAFTAMRSRGAKVADIAILVVAADDGVKPQTVEAFRIIEAAKLPYIVAINKMDKAGADLDRVRQELSSMLNIIPEEWGGKITCVPISAREGTGVVDLLDMVLLKADLENEGIKANPDADAAGTVVESHLHKGAGPIVTILIQNGTLRVGDQLCFNGIFYGKVRALRDYKDEDVEAAGPSMPVEVIGLKVMPSIGDILEVGDGKKVKFRKTHDLNVGHSLYNKQKQESPENDKRKKLNIIIKSDVFGSAEAIEESLAKIESDQVSAKIISKSLGNIGEGDIKRAQDSDAQIVGFNVKISPQIESRVRETGIKVNTFSIIYDLIAYVKKELESLVEPEYERVDLGRLKVLAIFRTENNKQIIGGKVLDGQAEADSIIEVMKNKEVVATGKMTSLQSGKQNVGFVEKDEECGLQYEGKPIIEVGDILQFHKIKEIKIKL